VINPGLKEKVVIVTGANHGIGAATAKAFAAQPAKVFMTYLRMNEVGGEAAYRANQAHKPAGSRGRRFMWAVGTALSKAKKQGQRSPCVIHYPCFCVTPWLDGGLEPPTSCSTAKRFRRSPPLRAKSPKSTLRALSVELVQHVFKGDHFNKTMLPLSNNRIDS